MKLKITIHEAFSPNDYSGTARSVDSGGGLSIFDDTNMKIIVTDGDTTVTLKLVSGKQLLDGVSYNETVMQVSPYKNTSFVI